jgi:hypothetical protein
VAGDWLPLESGLYAANVVLGKQRGEAAEQQVQQLVQYAAAAATHPGGKPCCSWLVTVVYRQIYEELCGDLWSCKGCFRFRLPLESGLYAANVVLGKQRGEAAEQQVQQLVQYAAAAASHPGGESHFEDESLLFVLIREEEICGDLWYC